MGFCPLGWGILSWYLHRPFQMQPSLDFAAWLQSVTCLDYIYYLTILFLPRSPARWVEEFVLCWSGDLSMQRSSGSIWRNSLIFELRTLSSNVTLENPLWLLFQSHLFAIALFRLLTFKTISHDKHEYRITDR